MRDGYFVLNCSHVGNAEGKDGLVPKYIFWINVNLDHRRKCKSAVYLYLRVIQDRFIYTSISDFRIDLAGYLYVFR